MVFINNYSSQRKNVNWLSESDNGIYYAMNKGLSMASGDYVAFLNSGDVFANSTSLDSITNEINSKPELDFIYGDLCFVDKNSNITRKWQSGIFGNAKLYFGWMPPHPMTTIRKEIIEKNLGFDIRYEVAADYDFMLRVLLGKKLKIKYVNSVLVHMEMGGVSNSSILRLIYANFEVMKCWFRLRGGRTPFWIFFTKPLSKLIQIRKIKSL